MKTIFILLFAILLTGCITPIRPWERDLLAQQKMQLIPDAMESEVDQKVFFSKEGSSGGVGVGGGGCGCN
jgi:starvation-inducible outer membrane lipoprotein